MLRVERKYAPKAEPTSTNSNTTTSAVYNRPDRPFCAGEAWVGDGIVCLGACKGTEGFGRVVGIDALADMARDGCDIGGFEMYFSAGTCITGTDAVGVTGKADVAFVMIEDGGSAGVLLPTTTGGTDGSFDSDGCDCWLRYVGLFIVSRKSLMPLWDTGLVIPGDE